MIGFAAGSAFAGLLTGLGLGYAIRKTTEETIAYLKSQVEDRYKEAEHIRLACLLHVEEIKRLEAVRDRLREDLGNLQEQVRQENARRYIQEQNRHIKASEAARKGNITRKLRKAALKEAA